MSGDLAQAVFSGLYAAASAGNQYLEHKRLQGQPSPSTSPSPSPSPAPAPSPSPQPPRSALKQQSVRNNNYKNHPTKSKRRVRWNWNLWPRAKRTSRPRVTYISPPPSANEEEGEFGFFEGFASTAVEPGFAHLYTGYLIGITHEEETHTLMRPIPLAMLDFSTGNVAFRPEFVPEDNFPFDFSADSGDSTTNDFIARFRQFRNELPTARTRTQRTYPNSVWFRTPGNGFVEIGETPANFADRSARPLAISPPPRTTTEHENNVFFFWENTWNKRHYEAKEAMSYFKVMYRDLENKLAMTSAKQQIHQQAPQNSEPVRRLRNYLNPGITLSPAFKPKSAAELYSPLHELEFMAAERSQGWTIFRVRYLRLVNHPTKSQHKFSAAISDALFGQPRTPQHIQAAIAQLRKLSESFFRSYLVTNPLSESMLMNYGFRRVFWRFLSSLSFLREYAKLKQKI